MSGQNITRHQMREYAFMLTFEMIFHNGDVEEVLKYAEETEVIQLSQSVLHIFNGVEQNKDLLDQHISKHLKKWTINRIPKVSLAVLRVAMFEILFSDDLDIDIIISEAVKIAQTYTVKKDEVSFINGVLSSVAKEQKLADNSSDNKTKGSELPNATD